MANHEKRENRRVYGAEAKQRCHREIHGAVVTVDAARTRAPEWWSDCRRKRLQSWAGTLRVIDVLVDAGAPASTVLHVPDVLRSYAEDRLSERDGNSPRAA